MPPTRPVCLALLTRLRVARLRSDRAAIARLLQQLRTTSAPLPAAARSHRRVQRLRAER